MLTDEKEIEAACQKVFPDCTVRIDDDCITITGISEYDFKFKKLNELSDALGTDEIDINKGEHHPGYRYSSVTYEGSYTDPPSLCVYRHKRDD